MAETTLALHAYQPVAARVQAVDELAKDWTSSFVMSCMGSPPSGSAAPQEVLRRQQPS
jgi:hypothetical protein